MGVFIIFRRTIEVWADSRIQERNFSGLSDFDCASEVILGGRGTRPRLLFPRKSRKILWWPQGGSIRCDNSSVKHFVSWGWTWKKHVKPDPSLCRPSDIKRSCGNAAKARHRLGWKPKVRFEDLIRRLVAAEMDSRTVI
jgi:hypothetical protein